MLGDPERALASHQEALEIAEETGDTPDRARAHLGLARLHRDAGRTEQAERHAARARKLGGPLADVEAATT